MAADKKISELPILSAVTAADTSVVVHNGTDYQFNFDALLNFIKSGISGGATVSFGSTLPQNNAGKNGDLFINTSAGSFAQKASGAWQVKYTLPPVNAEKDGTVLYGPGVPGTGTGSNNDTYINTNTGVFYRKNTGNWAQVFSMQTGPQGARGEKGDKGDTGSNGRTILSGTSNPSNLSTGTDGDFYINTNSFKLFGPKTTGVWPVGISLVGINGEQGETGPQGDPGATGADGTSGTNGFNGEGVPVGGTAGQVLAKASDGDYDTEWVEMASGDGVHAPDGIVSGLLLSITAENINVTPGSWRIEDEIYQTISVSNLAITVADETNNRIDLVYATTLNTVALLTGVASTNPVKPSLPINCVEIGFVLVTPSGNEVTEAPGATYVTTSQFINVVGDKSQLSTDATNSLVDAINEVSTKIGTVNQESVILKIFKKSNYR